MTSLCGKIQKVANETQPSVSLMLLPLVTSSLYPYLLLIIKKKKVVNGHVQKFIKMS